MNKSLKVNVILNVIRTISGILFPLITVPYLSRVLGKDGYGIFNYSVSIVSYFILLAGLGFVTYSIREGAKIRENKSKFQIFSSEIFSLNIISALVSYLLLALILIFSSKLQNYREYILIISANIAAITVGLDWINSVYEDYLYLTVRYVIIQLIAILLMVIFVHSREDLLRYAFIYLFSQAAPSIVNIFYIRKYVHIKLAFSKHSLVHLKPVLILFVSSIAMVVYVNSDITILGIIKGDTAVGIYSVASRIYAGTKQVAIAATVVTIPRLASYIGNAQLDEYNKLLDGVLNLLISITIPMFIGLFCVSELVMYVVAGQEYINGTMTLQILCIASVFSCLSYFFSQCVLIPNQKDKYFSISTAIGAIINVVLNFLIIPSISYDGAALTTLISEILVLIACVKFSHGLHKVKVDRNTCVSVLVSSIGIYCTYMFVKLFIKNQYIALQLSIIFSILIYVVTMVKLKNVYIIPYLVRIPLINKLIKRI